MKPALTNQELLDRSIHSFAMMLPPDKMEDIAAEIRSNLESLVEDRAAELGRDLSLGEMSAILKQHGHPMVVASRYRDRSGRGLISPDLFPLYWFTLRAIFAVWVTIRVIIAVFTLQGSTPAGSVLLTMGRDILLATFFIPAGVTLLFAVWEYLEFKFRYSERWKPESLPPVPAWPPTQRRPVVQIIGGVVWLIFWAVALFVPQFFWVWGGRGVFSPSATVYAMRPALWLLAFLWISVSWLRYTRLYALRRGRVAAVAAHRGGRRGIGARALPAARRRPAGRRPQLESRSGQVARDAESNGRGGIGADLYLCSLGVCAGVTPLRASFGQRPSNGWFHLLGIRVHYRRCCSARSIRNEASALSMESR